MRYDCCSKLIVSNEPHKNGENEKCVCGAVIIQGTEPTSDTEHNINSSSGDTSKPSVAEPNTTDTDNDQVFEDDLTSKVIITVSALLIVVIVCVTLIILQKRKHLEK